MNYRAAYTPMNSAAVSENTTSSTGKTIGELLADREKLVVAARGKEGISLQAEIKSLRDLADHYGVNRPFSSLPEDERARHRMVRDQASGGRVGSSGITQGSGVMGVLGYLGSLAMEHPLRAIALAVAVAMLYPLEQFATQRAAYYGNPISAQQMRITKTTADAETGPANATMELEDSLLNPGGKKVPDAYSNFIPAKADKDHGAADGGACNVDLPLLVRGKAPQVTRGQGIPLPPCVDSETVGLR